MKKVLLWAAGALVLIVVVAGAVLWVELRPLLEETVSQYDDLLWIHTGGGGNSVVLVSPQRDRVLVVDTKMGRGAARLRELVEREAPGAEVTIVNTHLHVDHTGGNVLYPHARVIAGTCDTAAWREASHGAALPDERIAPDQGRVLRVGNEYVEIRSMGAAHSFNDMVVYLHSRKLLVTGDLVFNQWHPAVFRSGGTDIGRWTTALETLLREYEIAHAVPGHGPAGGWEILTAQRDYFRLIRDAIDSDSELAALKRTYRSYASVSRILSFGKVVAFLEAK